MIDKKVKKKIIFKDLIIVLYEKKKDQISKVRNIEAFDNKGNLIWTAEEPKYDFGYFDMQIDEENNYLDADGGGGERYEINLLNGRIIKNKIIK